MHISLEQAERVIAAAKTKAEQIGVAASVAILDHGGHLVAFARIDGGFLGAIDLAQRKARTAVYFHRENQELRQVTMAGGEAESLELSNGLLSTIPGGIPLYDKPEGIVGAIGVSGGSAGQDYEIAQAGADVFGHPKPDPEGVD